jgi:hypothetical protein
VFIILASILPNAAQSHSSDRRAQSSGLNAKDFICIRVGALIKRSGFATSADIAVDVAAL